MNKKKYILVVFCIVMLVLFFVCFIIYKITGNNLILMICSPKYYIQFDNLEKVVIIYNPENSYFEKNHTIESYPELQKVSNYEIEVTDEKLLKLIQTNYQNKLLMDRNVGDIKSKGIFSIIINDDLEIYPKIYNRCTMKYKDNLLEVKFNQEIYDEMMKLIMNSVIEK